MKIFGQPIVADEIDVLLLSIAIGGSAAIVFGIIVFVIAKLST